MMKRLSLGVCISTSMALLGCGGEMMDADAMADMALPEEAVGTTASAVETASDFRFRTANRYAGIHGYAAGFGNFHEANYGAGVVRGTVLLKPGTVAHYLAVPRSSLGNTALSNIPELFRRAQDYGNAHGLGIALPSFEQGLNGSVVEYGIHFLHPSVVEFRDVPGWAIGYPDVTDAGAMMRAANDYASSNGFSAGLPTFHSAIYSGTRVYGMHLIRPGYADTRDVLADVLAMQDRFSFDTATVSGDNWARTLRRHEAAQDAIQTCTHLTNLEKSALRNAYRKAIRHSGTNEAGINARAELGGDDVWINFGVLFPQGDTEIAQTLIHEMMHIAGYSHPDRRNGIDTPYDGGPYYNSAPLRAELCIAGFQSIHSTRESSREPQTR
ncbi:hypothetical protein [Myxococcus xanthus]|uniref:hypothetical protein n=1 Tax=Myxococcus xanthus TaxID=34 RepID=UPI001CED4DE7|nr:hypothetical protein [Myxococcus xanthus]